MHCHGSKDKVTQNQNSNFFYSVYVVLWRIFGHEIRHCDVFEKGFLPEIIEFYTEN